MRAVRVVLLGAIVSGVIAMAAVAAAVYLKLILKAGPHEEFEVIAVTLGELVVATGTAVAFAIALAFGCGLKGVRRTAFVLAAFLATALAAPEVFAVATLNNADFMERSALGPLAVLLITIAAAGLLVIFIQWWIVRRYLFRPYHDQNG